MKLVLHLESSNGAAAETRVLETGTLTIGRGSENDWMLQDQGRTVSKAHCQIDRSGDGFLLTDISTNGVFINGNPKPLGRGHACAIGDGDRIGIGPYEIAAAIRHEVPALQFDDEDKTEPATGTGLVPSPYSGVHESPGSPIALTAEPWLQTIPGGKFGPKLRAAPIGWDAPPDPAGYAAAGQRATEIILPQTAAAFSDELEHMPATTAALRLPTAQVVLPTDWMDADPLQGVELAPVRIAPDVPLAELSLQPSDLQGAEPSLEPVPFRRATGPLRDDTLPALPSEKMNPQPAPASLPATAQHGAGDFFAGFLQGAGLPPDALAGLALDESGTAMGRLLRIAVEGVREILATRAMVKSELRADQTIVQAAGNNAMKFAPDAQRCLAAMVGQPPAGFLPGPDAMQQALEDIKFHELAIVAALNSVFGDLSTQLDPAAIAAKVRDESSFGSKLPIAREARCWAVYEESYRRLQESGAQNTGGSLLSPLAAAYGRQVRRAP